MKRTPESPPPMAFLEASRPPAGERHVEVAMDDLRLRIAGLDDSLADRLAERYTPYTSVVTGRDGRESRKKNSGTTGDGPASSGCVEIDLSLDEVDYFIDPPATEQINPVLLAFDADRIRYLGHRLAGWISPAERRGRMILARGGWEPAERAIENFVRVTVAWEAIRRGGALVHAAGAVWRDRAYIFYGPSGAGKSTLASVNERARIVSDDLCVVLPRTGGGLDLVGSPFRGTWDGGPAMTGRFPLVAGFRLDKSESARVSHPSRAVVFAGLVANLPFVAEAFNRRPGVFEQIEHAFEGIPLARLAFRKDDSFWDAVADSGL